MDERDVPVVKEKFKREVKFEPGYDYRNDPEKKRYGCHGMNIRFLLHGKLGTVQFLIYSGWLPTMDECQWPKEQVHPPMSADLGHHWKKRLRWMSKKDDDYTKHDKCPYLDGARPCWYDGSTLNAQPLFKLLLTEGDEAVWAALEAYYYQTRDYKNEGYKFLQRTPHRRDNLSDPYETIEDLLSKSKALSNLAVAQAILEVGKADLPKQASGLPETKGETK